MNPKGYFVDWTKENPVSYFGDRKDKARLEETHQWVADDGSPAALLAADVLEMDRETHRFDPATKSIQIKTQAQREAESDLVSDDIFDNDNSEAIILARAMIEELGLALPGVTPESLADQVKERFRTMRRER